MKHAPDSQPHITITPEHEPHEKLLTDVKAALDQRGDIWLLPSACYYDLLNKTESQALGFCAHPSAHYYRTRADRLAALCDKERIVKLFEYDAKTTAPRQSGKDDMCVELTPLALHSLMRHHIDCLYCYRHVDNTDRGFWCSDMPEPRVVFIPARNDEFFAHYEHMAGNAFPGTDRVRITATRGSGDPFAVFDSSTWRALPDWRELVAAIH